MQILRSVVAIVNFWTVQKISRVYMIFFNRGNRIKSYCNFTKCIIPHLIVFQNRKFVMLGSHYCAIRYERHDCMPFLGGREISSLLI